MADPGTPRSSRRSNRSGQSTRRTIVDSAIRMLREQGFAGFTLKGVAAVAGIAYGNLTYHFPTREDLIRAMTIRIAELHRERLAEAFHRPDCPASIESVASWLLENAVAPDTVRLFPELWAMASRLPEVASTLASLHDETVRCLATAAGIDPDDDASTPALDGLQALAMLAAGRTAVFGHRPLAGAAGDRVSALALDCVRPLLSSDPRTGTDRP